MEYVLIFAIIITSAVIMSLWSMRSFLKEIKNRQKKKNNIPTIQIIDEVTQAQKNAQVALEALKTGQIPIMVYEKIWMPTGTTHIIYSDLAQSIWQQQDNTAYEIIESPNKEKRKDVIAEQNIITYHEKMFYHSRRYIALNSNSQNNIQKNQWQAFIKQTHTPYMAKIHQTELEKILF